MRRIVTNRVAWSVGQSVRLVSLTEMAEQIELPFVVEDLGGPREPCIRWGLMSNFFDHLFVLDRFVCCVAHFTLLWYYYTCWCVWG